MPLQERGGGHFSEEALDHHGVILATGGLERSWVQHGVEPASRQELHDNIEQPARWRAQSGRFLEKSSLSGCSS